MENQANNTAADTTSATPGTDAVNLKRLFDRVIADPKNASKVLNSKLTESATKRKFQAAHDYCEGEKDSALFRYNTELVNIPNIDINVLTEAKDDIDAAEERQAQIKEIYFDLFAEDLVTF